jgi:hypothetical protein
MTMIKMSAAQSVVAEQQAYARKHGISSLFELATTAVIYARPPNVAAFVSEQFARMQAEGTRYTAAPAGAGVQVRAGGGRI